MRLTTTLTVLALFISTTYGGIAIYAAKEGEQIELDLGSNIHLWGKVKEGHKYFLKSCPEEDTSDKCTHWKDQNDELVMDSSARVYPNGTLVIKKARMDDVGAYFSPDEMERVVEMADGGYAAIPRTLINVMLTA